MKKKIIKKYLHISGDFVWLYPVGERYITTARKRLEWTIAASNYFSTKDETVVRLERVKEITWNSK